MISPQINLCTISFRHELASFGDLIHFSASAGFAGIELWGVHARALQERSGPELASLLSGMKERGLGISMISHYISGIGAAVDRGHILRQGERLVADALVFGADKIRIFAGNQSSRKASAEEWRRAFSQIGDLAELCREHNIKLVLETHPMTLADSTFSALMILEEVSHHNLAVNADLLHLWEAGDDPLAAIEALSPYTVYYHFKNINCRSKLSVFEPANIYSPGGTREGIVPLREGMLDYRPLIGRIRELKEPQPFEASIEWFGPRPYLHLADELIWLKELFSCSRGEVGV